MITSVTLGTISLKCNRVDKPQPPKISRTEINGRDGDLLQYGGLTSKNIILTGILIGTDKDTHKIALEGYRGTIQSYVDAELSCNVLIETVNIPTVGGQPNHYTFNIIGYVYNQT